MKKDKEIMKVKVKVEVKMPYLMNQNRLHQMAMQLLPRKRKLSLKMPSMRFRLMLEKGKHAKRQNVIDKNFFLVNFS